MARKLTLKTVTVNGPLGQPSEFDYAEMMGLVLKGGRQGEGVNLDQMKKALDALDPIEKATASGSKEVVLSDTQWTYLKEKVEVFQFGFSDWEILKFGLMITEAPEIGVTELKPAAAD